MSKKLPHEPRPWRAKDGSIQNYCLRDGQVWPCSSSKASAKKSQP